MACCYSLRSALFLSPSSTRVKFGSVNSGTPSVSFKIEAVSHPRNGGGGSGRRVWRRRKLTKKDDLLRYKIERIPFLEEQERKVKEQGKLLTMDIERLLLSEDNRFEFINEIAAEANEYVENNRDEYGGTKKALLHVISNRINDAGFYREEAYQGSDPFLPGPDYMKDEL